MGFSDQRMSALDGRQNSAFVPIYTISRRLKMGLVWL
jgi:hypothetical protein